MQLSKNCNVIITYNILLCISVLFVYLKMLVGSEDQFNLQHYKQVEVVCRHIINLVDKMANIFLLQVVPKQENFIDCGIFLCRVR